ncbi:MAG: hypothetical protein DMF69_01130, partial [Acidobacteria bacterium]
RWCLSPTSPTRKSEPSGRFRVILTGFSVERQTDDNVLESDGKGDEVFIMAYVAQYANKWWLPQPYPLDGVLTGNPPLTFRQTLTSIVMGDANNQEEPRLRAGTAGD